MHVVGGVAAPATNGSDIRIEAQNAGSGNQNGANIVLNPGASSGSGRRGSVSIGGGTTASALLQIGSGGPGLELDNTNNTQVLLNHDSSGWGFIGNNATGIWSLGYTNAASTNMDNSVLTWNTSGRVGIGTTSPAAKLDVAGEVKFGNTSSTCNATNEGQQRYNSTSKNMEFCNGTAWTAYGTGGSSGRTSCPSGFSLVGTSGSAEAYCISTDEETSANWQSAVTNCSNKNPAARLCSASEWAHACVKAATYGINNMTGNWEWVADLDDIYGVVMGNSGCDSFTSNYTYVSGVSRCCFR